MKRPFILLMSLVLGSPALGEHSVAQVLGLKDADIAAAVETGAGDYIDHASRAKDATRKEMNAETSYFLRNAPDAASRRETRRAVVAEPRKTQAEVERDAALQQLEFRRNVEDAMKQILGFNPVTRPESQIQPEALALEAAVGQPVPVDSRDRLVHSAVRHNPFRPQQELPRGFRDAPRVDTTQQIDQRVMAPARYEASPDDDDGKPVRLGLSGDSSGADFPVISMRRGSRKAVPSHVQTLPALRGDISELPPNLKPLKGLFERRAGGL